MADEKTFLGGLFDSIKSAGSGLLNIPKQIGQKYEAGSLFGTGGALGSLLSPEAKQEAQRQAILKLGLGLLAQGPSRTPISFGQSLASNLLGAQEEFGKGVRSELEGELTSEKILDVKRKKDALDIISNPDSTEEQIDKAILSLDPVEYYKLKNKQLKPSDLEAEYLENLRKSNPAEYNRIMKKRAERSGSDIFGFGGIMDDKADLTPEPPDDELFYGFSYSEHKSANQKAIDSGEEEYILEKNGTKKRFKVRNY